MLRLVFATALVLVPFAAQAQDEPPAPPLVGHIEGTDYVSPTGAFRMEIPVLPELGGTIRDTSNLVTFQDAFTTHISIAAFPEDATQKWQLSTLGPKDYLKGFFDAYVRPDFTRAFKNVQVETNALFKPNIQDGALIAYILIPGGSMFTSRTLALEGDENQPVAKRGNMMFVKNGYIFVISTELAERITEGSSYHKTSAEEDEILRDRLLDIAGRIRFLKPNPDDSTASK